MNLSPSLSTDTQAILLLTSYFSKARNDDVKPLTNSEWLLLNSWLEKQGASPANLLKSDLKLKSSLKNWHDIDKIGYDRIMRLLDRGHSLALAVEKWQRANLWVITQTDQKYPQRVINRMHHKSGPVLFGCGNNELLKAGGLAVIGSRNARKEDLIYSGQIGARAAEEEIVIVSGGARGVDESCMLEAMRAGGNVIGVLADSLFNTAMSSKWREGLMDNRVAMVSPFYPEAGFNVGNAMQRNKYIYCLAQSALVVHSGNKGGTLNGAKDNLKNNWVPLWVKHTSDRNAANEYLVQQGGRWVETEIDDLQISDLIQIKNSPKDSDNPARLEQEVINFRAPPAS